jgi:hypothetical protein
LIATPIIIRGTVFTTIFISYFLLKSCAQDRGKCCLFLLKKNVVLENKSVKMLLFTNVVLHKEGEFCLRCLILFFAQLRKEML